MEERLLDDFQPTSAKAWSELITKELKGASIESLNWQTLGLTGKPFYTQEDLPAELPNLQFENQAPEELGARHWVNYQVIRVEAEKEANQKAILALNNGATGILFQLESPPNFELLLKEILLPYCHIGFQLAQSDEQFIKDFEGFIEKSEFSTDQVQGFIQTKEKITWSQLPNFKSVIVGQKNSNICAELALILAETIDVLDQVDPSHLEKHFSQSQFNVEVGTSYFVEIAKHRALRLLLIQLGLAYGFEVKPAQLQIVSYSGHWNEPTKDEYNYLLRACTQAMSAIIGGTNAVVINPFYHLFPKNPAQAERMARNISTLLKDESYFDKIIDAAAGTYFLESLTAQIVEKSWQLLQDIEAKGGLSKITKTELDTLTKSVTV
uniref:methylmalonyl-CoA mutase family protein n=2 Tax=Roseivirga sp. TaxID=1964215 RepID=UPI0040475ECE